MPIESLRFIAHQNITLKNNNFPIFLKKLLQVFCPHISGNTKILS